LGRFLSYWVANIDGLSHHHSGDCDSCSGKKHKSKLAADDRSLDARRINRTLKRRAIEQVLDLNEKSMPLTKRTIL
jgi:hypothetical protein